MCEQDGRTWVVFGAYDKAVHVLDAETGERILPDFPTGDIIKGSVTDRPGRLPAALLRLAGQLLPGASPSTGAADRAVEAVGARRVSPTKWNNDWDGAGLVIDDYLFEGGENSQFHIVKLNRRYGPDGKVTVAPELVFNTPGWDDATAA